jgi:hypothetical protein
LLGDIIESRAYATAKDISDRADTAAAREKIPNSPLFDLVTEIEFSLKRKEIDDDRGAPTGS